MTATASAPTMVDTLLAKAKDRTAVFGVVGLGYVGLPLAMEIVRAGYRVIGFDVNSRVVDALNAGRSHIQDVSAATVTDAVQAKKFSATADLTRLKEPDVISISVPTPLSKTKDPDVSYVLAATESVKRVLRKGQLVVLESTTYPGTTRELMLPALESTGLKIGLANEMAIVCDKLGVDVWEVIEAASTKPFGFMKFTPGPGVGGHCIPLDPHYLAWKMPEFWVGKVVDTLNDQGKAVRGSHLLLVGVAYKKNIDDIRESPALDVIRLLHLRGAEVSYHDPHVPVLKEDNIGLSSVPLTAEMLRQADCVIIVTDHAAIDYKLISRNARAVVD